MSADPGGPPALEARLRIAAGGGPDAFTVECELALARGVLVLFGPSGAGKSLTVLGLAGLVAPRDGRIRLGGEVIYDHAAGIDVPAHRRAIGYVPQHRSLFPFRNVAENVAFGLPRGERRRGSPYVRELLAELGIAHLAAARPAALSGGECQRVALARALAVRPRLMLLDEPFVSIDQGGRAELRALLRRTLDRHGIPAVLVTHDADEALALGDTLALYERGRTVALGAPETLVRHAHRVELAGHAAGPPRPLGDGRAEITLLEASVTGSADVLQPDEDGTVRLDLHARRHPRRDEPGRGSA